MIDIAQFLMGFIPGLVIGRLWKMFSTNPEKKKKEGDLKKFLDRWSILLIAFMFVGASSWFLWEQQKCNEAFQENVTASQHFWTEVYKHPEDRELNKKLFAEWVKTFATNNEAREKCD